MFICTYFSRNQCSEPQETLDAAWQDYQACFGEEERIDEVEFYEVGPSITCELKVIRKETLVIKEKK